MYLCLDPGSKYLGYTIISNFEIINKGIIYVQKEDIFTQINSILAKFAEIKKVLIEKGEINLRSYELTLVNLFKEKKIPMNIYNAKYIRKKLKLERHPFTLGVRAKINLVKKLFPHTNSKDLSIHEIDSILLYIFHKKMS